MDQPTGARFQRSLELAIYLIVAAYFVSFAFWNAASETTLKLWFSSGPSTVPTFYVALAAFLVGFLLAALLGALGTLRHSADLRRCRREMTALEEEVARLRNLPIDDDLAVVGPDDDGLEPV